MNPCDEQRGKTFCISSTDTDLIDVVNAAMYLRRPLLITGKPRTGKTSLAYRIAYELQLGAVLSLPITARFSFREAPPTTLQEGLYRYDAIARFHEVQVQQTMAGEAKTQVSSDIGRFIQIGSLGTALLSSKEQELMQMVEAHLGTEVLKQAKPLITDFLNRRAKGGSKDLSADQLLNVVYLITGELSPTAEEDRSKFI